MARLSALAARWDRLADANLGVRFLDANLRGASQVVLQNNPVSGLLILIAIGWGALRSPTPAVFPGAVVGLVVGTTVALLLRVPQSSWRQGLYGFSPLLTGAALPTFLANRPTLWVCLVVAAAITTVVSLALANVLKTWGVPALTFPFVLTTWFVLAAAYQLSQLRIGALTGPALPAQAPAAAASLDAGGWVVGVLKGLAQVFLIDNGVSGALILVALLVSSRWSAALALLGSVLAAAFAVWLGVAGADVGKGLWEFNAVLTAIALGSVLNHPSVPVLIYTLLGIAATVFVQGALTSMLGPSGIPVLTAPFVVTTWLFALPKPRLTPIAQHQRLVDGLLSELRDPLRHAGGRQRKDEQT